MVKPEPQIYKFVLDTLKAKPSEVCRCFLSGKKNVPEILSLEENREVYGSGTFRAWQGSSRSLAPRLGLLLKDLHRSFSLESSTRGGHLVPLCISYRT